MSESIVQEVTAVETEATTGTEKLEALVGKDAVAAATRLDSNIAFLLARVSKLESEVIPALEARITSVESGVIASLKHAGHDVADFFKKLV
ncbi:Uncharacterised protein [uncultured archaeon]|nr:Uncharacterised protein [uncultured archaeon]